MTVCAEQIQAESCGQRSIVSAEAKQTTLGGNLAGGGHETQKEYSKFHCYIGRETEGILQAGDTKKQTLYSKASVSLPCLPKRDPVSPEEPELDLDDSTPELTAGSESSSDSTSVSSESSDSSSDSSDSASSAGSLPDVEQEQQLEKQVITSLLRQLSFKCIPEEENEDEVEADKIKFEDFHEACALRLQIAWQRYRGASRFQYLRSEFLRFRAKRENAALRVQQYFRKYLQKQTSELEGIAPLAALRILPTNRLKSMLHKRNAAGAKVANICDDSSFGFLSPGSRTSDRFGYVHQVLVLHERTRADTPKTVSWSESMLPWWPQWLCCRNASDSNMGDWTLADFMNAPAFDEHHAASVAPPHG